MLAPKPLPLSRYVYGTTRLGDETIPFADRESMARRAIDSGLSLHTSDQYGDALNVLKSVIDDSPNLIFKIGWESVDQVKGQIVKQLKEVGMERMAVGQLCLAGYLAEDFRRGGPSIKKLNALKEEGLVGQYVLEVWPWTSDVPFMALEAGHAHGLVDGVIFYLNPLQRFVTNELWDWIVAHKTPVVAMRTVGGGDVNVLKDNRKAPVYLRKRAAEVVPLFEGSGCPSWTEFCVRFALGLPFVKATVGATANAGHFEELVSASQEPQPLAAEVVDKLLALQRRWSDDHDRHAEPWSM